MKFTLNIFKKNDSKVLKEKATSELISTAYDARLKEIESLRKYDRGEKTITPGNLTDIVRSI